jgi:hypothetical protein
MSALGEDAVAPDGTIDVQKLDPVAQKAFQYAVDFYQKDHLLNSDERSILADTYSTISYATLGFGWGTFFAVTSIPFYRQKLRTGSTKGTNVGIAMLFGLGAMMVASPYAAHKSYNWQLEKLRSQNEKCYEVAKFLKPGEATKWTMYYKLTKDHPEHIMKDPRSKEAAEQRKKTIYTGRDPLGLYSGPRVEMSKRKVEQSAQPPQSQPTPVTDELITDGDPFGEPVKEEKKWSSAWDRIRDSNSPTETTSDNRWARLRNAPSTATTADDSQIDQSDFDKLLEQERQIGEDESKKW